MRNNKRFERDAPPASFPRPSNRTMTANKMPTSDLAAWTVSSHALVRSGT